MNIVNGEKPLPTPFKFDKSSLKSRFNPRYPGQINIALDLFPGGRFNVKINQSLILDDRHANLLRVGGIHQHALSHVVMYSRFLGDYSQLGRTQYHCPYLCQGGIISDDHFIW